MEHYCNECGNSWTDDCGEEATCTNPDCGSSNVNHIRTERGEE